MADDLEARLESHAQAFEGLLSLIPANEYYSKDNSDQWQRKKQTKEQKRQAKRAKLDPANQKSAKDVMDENERKRKRELGIDDDEDDESSAQIDLSTAKDQPAKKQKVDAEDDDEDSDDGADATSSTKKLQAEKRKEKRRLKKEKADKQKAKLDAKKAARKQEPQSAAGADESADEDMQDAGDLSADEAADDAMDFSGLVDNDETSTPASPDQPEVFDNSTAQSATSSTSSIGPASNPTEGDAPAATKPKKALALKLPEVNAEELQARLKARIEALRAQRKADGPTGGPRNRQELLESRRKKEEARKQHKKELRLKAKEEEERLNNERLRGSGSPLATPDIFSPRPVDENNFSFGRVAFDDEETDPTLGSIAAHKKKKGPSDIKTALAAAERKAQRLAGMDEDKRKEIEEKDMWLNAKKRAHGERVKDDQSLLKKTLKRKTDQKTKSATQWNERLDNVKKGKEMKDKKRTENLAKRAAEKGSKKGGKKGASGGAKKKARPGFEGKGFKA
ncbi:SURF6-domain-containing protein [Aureobasidium sp. EXF-10727]|nr:SURF6-domain-containing protein [Aureobasidium sp. EXF-10727]